MPLFVLPTTIAGWLTIIIPFLAGTVVPKVIKVLINRGKTDVEIKREAYARALKTEVKEDDALAARELEISLKNLASLEALVSEKKSRE